MPAVAQHVVVEQRRLAATLALGLVEREVGTLHQLVEEDAVQRRQGDADRG